MAEREAEVEPSIDPQSTPLQPVVSRWAIAALGTSLAFVCPLLTVIGPLLAVRALVEIKANPNKTGRGMAIAALWIGAIAFVGWIAFMFWWQANVRDVLIRGPQAAIVAGFAGDRDAFRNQFIGDGATTSDATIDAFIAELRSRHGGFQLARQDDQAASPDTDGDTSVLIPYELLFDRGAAKADVRVKLFASGLKPKLQSITVKNAQKTPLTYP